MTQQNNNNNNKSQTFFRLCVANGESFRTLSLNTIRAIAGTIDDSAQVYVETTYAPFDPTSNYRITRTYHLSKAEIYNLQVFTVSMDYATKQAFHTAQQAAVYMIQLMEMYEQPQEEEDAF